MRSRKPQRVLFTATVPGHITSFHLPYLRWLQQQGCEVHVATGAGDCGDVADVRHQVSFERSPLSRRNLRAFRELRSILAENEFDLVHTHTPAASAVTRLAAASLGPGKRRPKVLYTAHGFHFFKGAPPKNWLVYFPVEFVLAHLTDGIVTINQEDYATAKRFLHTDVFQTSGVGVDLAEFRTADPEQRAAVRRGLGVPATDTVLIYPAELSTRKRQEWLIRSLAPLLERGGVHLLLPGGDSLNGRLQEVALQLGVAGCVHFLGHRSDIAELLGASDIGVTAAQQEGLPVNVLEAMASGLPVVASACRGNRDLVVDGETGRLLDLDDSEGFCAAVEELIRDPDLRRDFGGAGRDRVKAYSLDTCLGQTAAVYHRFLPNQEQQPVRVLHVPGAMNRGGAETMIMNWYRAIDPKRVHFSFLSFQAEDAAYDNEIRALGGQIIKVPAPSRLRPLTSMRRIWQVMREHGPYDVVHAHTLHASWVALIPAALLRVPIRISHSHNTSRVRRGRSDSLYERASQVLIRASANRFVACSEGAGDYLHPAVHGRMGVVVRNAVDVSRFSETDPVQVDELRRGFGIGRDTITLLSIARLEPEKNHEFLLRLAEELSRRGEDYRLLCVGVGPLREQLEARAESLGVADRVSFLGLREDVPALLNLADRFVLPSLHEGLPVTLVEAQAAGCRAIASDRVTTEVDLGIGGLCFLPIDGASATSQWCDEITRRPARIAPADAAHGVAAAGYELSTNIDQLYELYDA